jgi:transposase InsO family protein
MDDYSRFIVSWELCERMKTEDVKRSIDTVIYNTNLEEKNFQDYYLITEVVISLMS